MDVYLMTYYNCHSQTLSYDPRLSYAHTQCFHNLPIQLMISETNLFSHRVVAVVPCVYTLIVAVVVRLTVAFHTSKWALTAKYIRTPQHTYMNPPAPPADQPQQIKWHRPHHCNSRPIKLVSDSSDLTSQHCKKPSSPT